MRKDLRYGTYSTPTFLKNGTSNKVALSVFFSLWNGSVTDQWQTL